MNDSMTIACPNCKATIPVTESLAKPLIERERARLERAIGERESAIEERESELARHESELKRRARAIDEKIETRVAARIAAESKHLEAEAARNATIAATARMEQKDRELEALRATLLEHREMLAGAQSKELELERERNRLEQKVNEVDLEVERRVHEHLETATGTIKQTLEERYTLEIQDRDTKLSQLGSQIEELQRRLAQGSQQLQGESQELTIEQELRAAFPMDTFVPVPKGELGADLVQTVVAPGGQVCGSILWECKRTKNWNAGWLVKLRTDQREAAADVSVLVSQALPPDVTNFKNIDDVWVARRSVIVPMASMLRVAIIRIAIARARSQGRQTKAEMIYDYLTSGGFAHRILPVIESLGSMRRDLDKRRARVEREMAKEEQQIRIAEGSVHRLIGDIRGIAGIGLDELEGDELPALVGGFDEPEAYDESLGNGTLFPSITGQRIATG